VFVPGAAEIEADPGALTITIPDPPLAPASGRLVLPPPPPPPPVLAVPAVPVGTPLLLHHLFLLVLLNFLQLLLLHLRKLLVILKLNLLILLPLIHLILFLLDYLQQKLLLHHLILCSSR
jgi:hypothetical protein